MTARRCLDCPALIRSGSRCAVHQQEHERRRSGSGWQRQRDNDDIKLRDGGCVMRAAPGHRCFGLLVVDHVVPLADGGADTADNKRTLCTAAHDAVTAEWRRR